MNFTEMEAKVREATNNEPWGNVWCSKCTERQLTDYRGILYADAGDCQRDLQLVRTQPTHTDTNAIADSSSQLLNEIMPMIYKRFTEKASEEWRQIYKVCSECC